MKMNIQKWHDKLVSQRTELTKQMQAVSEKYPLVALAYKLQIAVATDKLVEYITVLPSFRSNQSTHAHNWIVDYLTRKRNRDRCLGSAKTVEDAYGCLSDYPLI